MLERFTTSTNCLALTSDGLDESGVCCQIDGKSLRGRHGRRRLGRMNVSG
jgi:hypothetical protein